MPYTAFNARKSYIKKNKDIIIRFTKAIDKGLKYTKNNSPEKLAKTIGEEFPDISYNDLVKTIKRYKDANSWLDNPYISEKLFKNLEDIMIDSKEINKYVPYNKLVKYYK